MNQNENNNRASISSAYLEQDSSHESLAKNGFKGFTSHVCIKVISYRKFVHDPDGILVKAIIDGLVHTGILADDSTKQINEVCFDSYKSKEERTEIIIEEV